MGTNFNEILIEPDNFSWKEMTSNLSSPKWPPFCVGLNLLKKTSHGYHGDVFLGDRGSKRMAPPPPQEPVPNRSSIIDCSSGHSSPRVSRDMDRIEHIETMVTDCTPKPHSPNLQTETRALRESAKDSLSPKAVRRPSLEMVSPRRGSIGVQLAESIAMELVELVRQNTGLSHDKSKVAVGTVVSHLRENVPAFRSNMDVILRGLHKVCVYFMGKKKSQCNSLSVKKLDYFLWM